ncbi:XK-related protein [Nesidiocoris tenuis]|uniref:XK-related protein n=1 Tax=Nesidiocoris tenuis TaxID=355587 RepID=A0ABN7B663_9HEMI|nr:XK-related protein [Nesidiocoris tenuis]
MEMSTTKQFLPLCDLLFNIISLVVYFTDIVFDLTSAYALYQRNQQDWAHIVLFFATVSLVTSQIVSLRWFLSGAKLKTKFPLVTVHVFGLGILWRYFKLLLPVHLPSVKLEVRDLCVLRLVHAFAQSAPLLLVELHLLLNENLDQELRDLNVVSVCLSLFSVCWALASFSKNVRTRSVHKLVLTWLGVIFQFTWRLGTVGSRAMCLVLYASLYGPWVLLVVLLHWVSMFLWIVSTGSLFKVDEPSTLQRTCLSSVIAFVYVLAYINLQETGRHKHKMVLYYVVMTLENALLCFAWYLQAPYTQSNQLMPIILATAYLTGLMFMVIYYRFFHVRRLNYQSGGRMNTPNESLGEQSLTDPENGCAVVPSAPEVTTLSLANGDVMHSANNQQKTNNNNRYRYYGGLTHNHHGGIPGVFNCRFTNPYSAAVSKRKKKKPTSFVPPPSILPSNHCPVPFWCRPLVSDDHRVISRSTPVDIRAKLEEKKRLQLAALRDIEEELRRQQRTAELHNGYPQELVPSHLSVGRVAGNQEVEVPYTLPRQSRYLKRSRKPAKVTRYCPPANSSDGDVDSEDNQDDHGCWHTSAPQLRLHSTRFRHETKL